MTDTPEPKAKPKRGDRLAQKVADFLEALENEDKIDRCSYPYCKRLAAGEPDFGPNVEDAVCEKHIPQHSHLIGCHEETTAALRDLLKELEKFGHHYDPETGKPKS